MDQPQREGMEGLALKARGLGRDSCPALIDRVANQGVAQVLEVNADLMGAARLQSAFHKADGLGLKAALRKRLDMGHCGLPTGLKHGLALAVLWVSPNGCLNGLGQAKASPADCEVLPSNCTGLELPDQVGLCL